MKKLFTLIFCLFFAYQESHANLGAAYLDDPNQMITMLQEIAPVSWFSYGAIDKKISGLVTQKSTLQYSIDTLKAAAENIKTVKEGKAGWGQTISNWWYYGGNSVVANMDPKDFDPKHVGIQALQAEVKSLDAQIAGWQTSKNNAISTQNLLNTSSIKNQLQKIYLEGPKNQNDRLQLELLHTQLKGLKSPVEQALRSTTPLEAQGEVAEKLNQYAKDKLFGNQEAYAAQSNKLWWARQGDNINNLCQSVWSRLLSSSKYVFNLLPYAESHPYTAGTAALITGLGLAYVAKTQLNWKGRLALLAAIGATLGARAYCSPSTGSV